MLITVWAGAALGVAFSVAWISAPRALCAATYIALGWVAVHLRSRSWSTALPLTPLILIAAGGVLYTAGAVIFALGRPNPWPRTFGFHEIFHVFVILAAVAHFVAMAGWIVMHERPDAAGTTSTAAGASRRATATRLRARSCGRSRAV